MVRIQLKQRLNESPHIFLLTSRFVNAFGLPEKVTDYFERWFKEEKAKGSKGKKVLSYNYIGKHITIMLVDEKKDAAQLLEEIRRQGASSADAVNSQAGQELHIHNQTRNAALSLAAAEGAALACYRFVKHKSSAESEKATINTIVIANSNINQKLVNELQITCDAVARCRDLVNEPVNVLNAVALSNAFVQMGKEAGFKVEVLKKTQIQKLKMGGLLAVNAGSVDEPTFTIMEYKPRGAKNKQPLVLVGKGVVYDTGGLSLKPTPNSMDMMKCDMAGAAAVGTTMYALAKAGIKAHVIGLVPATDNRPGFNAFAPGDIITMMDGSTVEMLNSDAEGRMILADALHYAKQFKPKFVIDLATLTGAAVAAIGTSASVGMGTMDVRTKTKLLNTGFQVHERIAEFPFWDDYSETLKSDVADQKNLGGPYAGSITAGKFLSRYTDSPYFHLDIAGPAYITAKDSYRGKGGTGVGVRLLFQFIKSLS